MQYKVLKVYPSFILGKCRCGYCDEDIPVARGRYGDLRRFAYGHNARGVNNPKYRGTGVTNHNYEWMNMPWHPNAGKDGRVYKHVWMMSRKLGRPLENVEVVSNVSFKTQYLFISYFFDFDILSFHNIFYMYDLHYHHHTMLHNHFHQYRFYLHMWNNSN